MSACATVPTSPVGILLGSLRAAGGDQLVSVLVYGSRVVPTGPDRHSAYDLVIVVDGYRAFYRRLRDAGHMTRSAGLLALVSRVLAPTVIAFWPEPPDGPLAKCLVLSRSDFERALGPRRRDHFCVGRMVHRTQVLHTRDPAMTAWIETALAGARASVLGWTLPFVNGSFSVDGFCRRMLEVSYGGEIRPEASDRVAAVYEGQRAFLRKTYTPILEAAVARGVLERAGRGYRAATPPRMGERLRLRAYFFGSKVRATTRWLKHVVTFDQWLTYITHKVRRRTGIAIEITEWERRFPFPLLLPKLFRVLRFRDGGGVPPRRSLGRRNRTTA